MKRFLLALAMMFCLAAGGVAHAKIPVVVALSVDANEQNYIFKTYLKFIELADKYSDGEFDFRVFPSMQLGDEQETVRALQTGSIQISALATNNYAPFSPSYGWMNMPYLFDSLDEFRSLVDAMWDQTNEWGIREGNCRTLMVLDIGYRQITTNSRHPVRSLADVKGVKIRVPQNVLMLSTFQALGFAPAAISFAETFNALQQGVVDGQEGCFNNVVTLKFYEAQKYATMINYAVHSAAYLTSETWLQKLPEKARNALIRAGREAMAYERGLVAGMLETDDKLMRHHGMELLGLVSDWPEWQKLGRTAWPKCYQVIGGGKAERGKEIMDQVMKVKEGLARK